MSQITDFLRARYVEGGRQWPDVDCWGLVIHARHVLFGLPLLSDWGSVTRKTSFDMQRAYRKQVKDCLESCSPMPGSIAAVMKGSLCTHVGLVIEADGRLAVLDINPERLPSITRLDRFEARYLRVIYYRDRNLSEQA